jgi:single-stranded DNA-binding protein
MPTMSTNAESNGISCSLGTDWAEYAATKLKKGDRVHIQGTLVRSTYEKEVVAGKNKTTLKLTVFRSRRNPFPN